MDKMWEVSVEIDISEEKKLETEEKLCEVFECIFATK